MLGQAPSPSTCNPTKPVNGRANEALRRLVAKRAGVAPSRVSVVKGEKARDKVVRVEGLDEAELRERLLG